MEQVKKPKRVIVNRRPRAKLTKEHLLAPEGLPEVYHTFPEVFRSGFKGRGHEAEDLTRLLGLYQRWQRRLFPYCDFNVFVKKLEQLGSTAAVKNQMRELRQNVLKLVDEKENQPEAAGAGDEPCVERLDMVDDDEFVAMQAEQMEEDAPDDFFEQPSMAPTSGQAVVDQNISQPPRSPANVVQRALPNDDELMQLLDEQTEVLPRANAAALQSETIPLDEDELLDLLEAPTVTTTAVAAHWPEDRGEETAHPNDDELMGLLETEVQETAIQGHEASADESIEQPGTSPICANGAAGHPPCPQAERLSPCALPNDEELMDLVEAAPAPGGIVHTAPPDDSELLDLVDAPTTADETLRPGHVESPGAGPDDSSRPGPSGCVPSTQLPNDEELLGLLGEQAEAGNELEGIDAGTRAPSTQLPNDDELMELLAEPGSDVETGRKAP
ncbi:unnamed protein product [Ostreobium quekettii]|uniref:Chromosome segregation in meiosis protein 3 domain-containing protein n=1 Tax=Ostreobium quekettii TaxID=121088 RepID=A0A8S1JAX4_9CHLO|nr:unnamed protein product [Ostreobium quekettii]